jgi:hypothetical protein
MENESVRTIEHMHDYFPPEIDEYFLPHAVPPY